MNVLAIDQGTSSTKALVVAEGGEVLGESSAAVNPRPGPGGAVEQDPQELLESIVAAGRGALDAAGAGVEAVGIANQGETVLRWDRDSGMPFGPALSWQDRRAVTVTRELADRADRLTEITGLPVDPYFAAPKMAWLRREGGEEGVVTTVDAWLNQRLTGAFVTDAATASRTLLLDLESTTWSEEACAAFGLDPAGQPAVVDCDAAVGKTEAFGASLPVTGLVVDQQAALFAESCFEAGEAKCTYGTGAFILATVGEQVARSRSRLAACVAWRLDGTTTYCLDGQVYSAGSAVSWLRELELIAGPEDLDRVGGDSGPGDVVFVPSLAGLGAPFWAPEARGGWLGLSLSTRRDDLVRALIWGIAAQVAALARAMGDDAGQPLERLRVDGGLTRSGALMQAQADLLQAPVELYPAAEATALGAGALARLGAGAAGTPAEAVGDWSPAAVYEPRMAPDEAQERLARWDAAARALVELARDER
ncbi:MAG: carbohydrate kinase [Actinobacteria bacterium]|nr:MAG: carbohydrate kinase [Actinomycetota bacterium]